MSDAKEKTAYEKLSQKHKAFVSKYMANGFNATRAYMDAYNKDNYQASASSAHTLLKKHEIKDAIDEKMREYSMSESEILGRLTQHGRGSIEEFLTFDEGKHEIYIDIERARKAGVLGLVQQIEQVDTIVQTDDDATVINRKFKVKLYSSQAAMKDLGRFHAMFTDKKEVEHTGAVSFNIVDAVAALREADKEDTIGQS